MNSKRAVLALCAAALVGAACSTGGYVEVREQRDRGLREEVARREAGALAPGTAVAQPAPAPSTVPVLGGFVAKQDLQFDEGPSAEGFAHIEENPFFRVQQEPVSTFAADVDTASYALVRRMVRDGRLPPAGAVRLEEMVNYFPASDPGPTDANPLRVNAEAAACPWAAQHRLVRISVKAREENLASRPSANLVFLIDVSGSMQSMDKLPLVQESMKLLAENLRADDRVSMAVYAGSSGLVLPPTPGDHRAEINAAIDRLQAGGSTNGGAGIRLAYDTARSAFVPGGVNRVVLCTDGDFNVGVTSRSELVDLVKDQARSGVFLSVLGFGVGNVKDDTMESLADKGNGNYAYVDGLREARKVLVEQAGSTLVTLAKDVKIQVEFNPATVAGYRLLGYENRLLAKQDFTDDKKDAGEVGTGHVVTAFYEIVPAGTEMPGPQPDPLKYQQPPVPSRASQSGDLLTVRVRWKEPEGTRSREIETALRDDGRSFAYASADFRFGSAVAEFAHLLRKSQYAGNATWDGVLELAGDALGPDPGGHRAEFLEVVRRARDLAGATAAAPSSPVR